MLYVFCMRRFVIFCYILYPHFLLLMIMLTYYFRSSPFRHNLGCDNIEKSSKMFCYLFSSLMTNLQSISHYSFLQFFSKTLFHCYESQNFRMNYTLYPIRSIIWNFSISFILSTITMIYWAIHYFFIKSKLQLCLEQFLTVHICNINCSFTSEMHSLFILLWRRYRKF